MRKWKRCLAAVLTAAMFFTLLPAPVSAAAEMEICCFAAQIRRGKR